jgi:hypothetical protein
VAGLKRAFRQSELTFFGFCQPLNQEKAFAAFLRTLFREDWVVYAKRPFGGPEHVLHYLARYTHRVAISNHRLVNVTDTHVSFRWKDYAHQQAPSDDPQPRGVSAPVSPACPASRIPTNPLLRSARQPTSRCTASSFAGRSYSHVRSPFSQRLPRARFCGGALPARARCALSSDSPQTNSTGTKAPRSSVLTAHSIKPLTARSASLWQRGATSVPNPQNHPLCLPSCSIRNADLALRKGRKGIRTLGEPGFPRARHQMVGIQTP